MAAPPGSRSSARPSPRSRGRELRSGAHRRLLIHGTLDHGPFAGFSHTGDTMRVDSSEFGSITIDGETYHHDVLIRLSGKVKKRKKELSKKIFGTSHIMSLDEAEFVYEKGSEVLVLGTGQNDNVRLSPEAAELFTRKGCEVLAEATPRAIATFNRAKGRRIGLFHVTC